MSNDSRAFGEPSIDVRFPRVDEGASEKACVIRWDPEHHELLALWEVPQADGITRLEPTFDPGALGCRALVLEWLKAGGVVPAATE